MLVLTLVVAAVIVPAQLALVVSGGEARTVNMSDLAGTPWDDGSSSGAEPDGAGTGIGRVHRVLALAVLGGTLTALGWCLVSAVGRRPGRALLASAAVVVLAGATFVGAGGLSW